MLATANADENGVRFEATVSKSLASGFPVVAEGADLVGGLPADSWLALAQPDLGKTLDSYVDLYGAQLGGRDNIEQQFKATTGLDLQDDVISWMGDWALFVRGTSVSELDGALVIETSDEEASGRVLDTLARFARQSADSGERVLPLQISGGGEGWTLRTEDVPQPIHLFQRDGKVVVAYGDSAAEAAVAPSADAGRQRGVLAGRGGARRGLQPLVLHGGGTGAVAGRRGRGQRRRDLAAGQALPRAARRPRGWRARGRRQAPFSLWRDGEVGISCPAWPARESSAWSDRGGHAAHGGAAGPGRAA